MIGLLFTLSSNCEHTFYNDCIFVGGGGKEGIIHGLVLSVTNANILAIVNGFFGILNLILAQSVASPLSKHCYCICYSTR